MYPGTNYGHPKSNQSFPGSEDYGPEFEEEFNGDNQRYRNVFRGFGYRLEQNIAKGDEPFDNQIWVVRKIIPPAHLLSSPYVHLEDYDMSDDEEDEDNEDDSEEDSDEDDEDLD